MSLETEAHAWLAKKGMLVEGISAVVAEFVRNKAGRMEDSLRRIADGAHFSDCPAELDPSAPCDCHVGEALRGLGEVT